MGDFSSHHNTLSVVIILMQTSRGLVRGRILRQVIGNLDGLASQALRDFDAAPEAEVSEFAGVQGIKAPSEGTGTRAVGNIVSA